MGLFDKLGDAVGTMLGGGQSPEEAALPKTGYENEEKIKSLVNSIRKGAQSQRWILERDWFRNVLFYLGNQWIIFDKTDRRWRERKLRPSVPKPMTNRYAATVDTILPVVTGQKPLISIGPATDDTEDKAAADVAERLIPVLEEEVGMSLIRPQISKWVVLTGNCFGVSIWNKNGGKGRTYIHLEQCLQCGKQLGPIEIADNNDSCPDCGGEQFQPLENTRSYPEGCLEFEVHSPFEAMIDFTKPLHKSDYYQSAQSFTLDYIRATWPDKLSKISADQKGDNTGQQYLNAIAYSTELTGFGSSRGTETTENAIVTRTWHLPTPDFPEGLYAVECAGIIAESGPLYSYKVDSMGNKSFFLPVTHYKYQEVPGRVWAKTPCDDLVPKQIQRNELESLIQLIIMRGIYNAILLGPGTNISTLSGEAGQIIKYSGMEPKVVNSASVPAAVFEWLTKIDSEFEELAGTFDVIKGKNPTGVEAGVALQLLSDRAMSRFGPVFDNYDESHRQWADHALSLFKLYADTERINVIEGKKGSYKVDKFSKADLTGSVNIKTESTKARPQSQLMQQLAVQQLEQMGIINPQLPTTRLKIAQLYGMGNLVEDMDDEQMYATSEWEKIMQGIPAQVSMLIDNHEIHIAQHKKDARNSDFMSAPKEIQAQGILHIMNHMQSMMQLQAALNPQPAPEQNGKKPAAKPAPKPTDSKVGT